MPYPITSDLPLVEAGRQVLAAELAIVEAHFAAVRDSADETGVHETRKAIRRTRTAMRAFGPYFAPGALAVHRRNLRRIMRRLAPSRDMAVMLLRLDEVLAAGEDVDREGLSALRDALAVERAARDDAVRAYLERKRVPRRLAAYRVFLESPGSGVLPVEPRAPVQVRHLAPLLLYGRLADVRVYEGPLHELTLPELHSLRIRCKELRYVLEFFEAALGPGYEPTHGLLCELLDVLGAINDAHVATHHLRWLAETATGALAAGSARFEALQADWIARDRAALAGLWERFGDPGWREAFAGAVAAL